MARKRKIKSALKPIVIKRNTWKILLRKSVKPLVITGSFLVIFFAVKEVLLASPSFNIQKIMVMDDKGNAFKGGTGISDIMSSCFSKNMFSVDIKKTAYELNQNNPDVKKIVVNRVMPNTLLVVVEPRVPIAVIKTSRNYPIDNEGVLLSDNTQYNGNLPFITGVSVWGWPKPGQVLDSKKLKSAITLIRLLDELGILKNHRLMSVDVSNVRNITFVFDNGCEIRLGYGEIDSKLKRLAIVLNDPKIDLDNLSYIDLRFDDTILGPR